MATKSTNEKPKSTTTTKKTTKSSAKTTAKDNTKTTAKKTSVRSKKVTEADIRKKAQEIYDKRILQGVPGSPESDWLKAEKELLS